MIVELRAENFQRLKAVRIVPRGRLVQLTGANEQGKTSILEAIASAVRGKDACPTDPIRGGTDKAWVSLDLGDKIVRRTFSRGKDGKPYTTSLSVEAKVGDGTAKMSSPQAVINSLLGDISFDPLAFLSMAPKAQVDALRRFVPGVDFASLAQQDEQDRQGRAEANRRAKDVRTSAEAIKVAEGLPAERIDENSLFQKLTGAAKHNSEIELGRVRRAEAQADIERVRGLISTNAEKIQELERQIQILTRENQSFEGDLDRMTKAFAATPLPPDAIDISEVSAELERARQINAQIGDREARSRLLRESASTSSQRRATAIPLLNGRSRSAMRSQPRSCLSLA